MSFVSNSYLTPDGGPVIKAPTLSTEVCRFNSDPLEILAVVGAMLIKGRNLSAQIISVITVCQFWLG